MDKNKKAVLIGLAIGDGHLRLTKNGDGTTNKTTAQLALLHSTSQLDYLEWKRERLISILGGRHPNISIRKVFNTQTNKYYGRCELNKSHRYFRIVHKWLYPQGRKYITRRILDYLSPESIAIWVMDDGGIKKYTSKKTGKISSCQFYLATYVSKEEAVVIQDYFREVWGINFLLSKERDNKWRHYCNTEETKKLSDLVRPFMLPSLSYKIL